MNFFKPKFWDKNQISFFSILLFPISLLIKVLSFLDAPLLKLINVLSLLFVLETSIWVELEKHHYALKYFQF